MIETRVTITEKEFRTETVQDNLPVLALNKFLRGLPPEQRGFFKDCRIVAVIPHYMPRGDFKESEYAMKLDRDQLNWFIKRHPEFKACDDTANNHLSTGGKIISVGGGQ